MNLSSLSQLLLHTVGFGSFAYAIYYDLYEVTIPDSMAPTREKFGGQAKYLTFLNMVLQLVYFGVCLLADVSRARSSSALVRVRDVMFAAAAFPVGIFVAFIFWSIWAVDRELILPARYDPYFPSFLNHLMHTTVLPLQLGELVLCHHDYPSRKVGGAINGLLTFAYLVWLNVVYHVGGFWVYPVFKVLSPTVRPVFMLFCCLCGVIFYFLGEFLNTAIWGNKKKGPSVTSKAKKGKRS